MSAYPKRLLSIKDLTPNQIQKIFDLTAKFKLRPPGFSEFSKAQQMIVVLAFLEPSTRTRLSFELAAHRLGARPVFFSGGGDSSVVKGESAHETMSTVLAMRPDVLVLRHPGDEIVRRIAESTKIPVINAGDGKGEHPTQALLDAFTILEKRGQLEGEKVLFVGDVEHSRVARSDFLLFSKLGAKVAVCSPKDLLPKSEEWRSVHQFSKLDEALEWATVCMGLRVQKERHLHLKNFDIHDYIANFRLDKKNLKPLRHDAIIMHPGPYVSNEDLTDEVLDDKRCVIHEQVSNGVFIRMTLLAEMLGVTI